jgi:hypothetical protein
MVHSQLRSNLAGLQPQASGLNLTTLNRLNFLWYGPSGTSYSVTDFLYFKFLPVTAFENSK